MMALLFLIRFLFLAGGLCLLVGVGTGARGAKPRPGQSEPRVTPAVAAKDEQIAFAAKFFRRHCASCHGENFTGAESRDQTPEIPDFTSGAWQKSRSDAQLFVSILDGKGKRMPAQHGRLDRDKARAMVAFIRQVGPSRPAPTTAEDDFERRFAELQQQLDELREQYRRLVEAAEKQEAKDANKKPPGP
jgi:mono/diheme cytochrome c family protein